MNQTAKMALQKINLSWTSNSIEIEGITDRLFIRSYITEDHQHCHALYGDPLITGYFDHGEPRSTDEIDLYIKERGRSYFDKGLPFGLYSVFLKDQKEFIGQIDLVPTENPGEVEIGWIFHKKFQYQGYGSEAAIHFLMPLINLLVQENYCSLYEKIHTVVATAHPDNKPSEMLIRKLGLTFFRSGYRYGGKPRNWFALTLRKHDETIRTLP